MRVIFWGTPQYAVPTLERLLQHPDFEVLAVVTQPDKRRGRGQSLDPSPVKAVAVAHQVPVWQPRRVKKHAPTLAQLAASQADAFVIVAYGQLLSPEILALPRLGCINAHGSLLPAYRGAAPIQWSLVDGQPETGVTTMLMDAGMDTGAMLLKGTIPVDLFDQAQEVAQALALMSADLIIDTLQQLEAGTLIPTPQDDTQATYARLIEKEDFWLDWSRPAIALHNQVRGFYPQCFTTLRNTPLKITATVPLGQAGITLPTELAPVEVAWAAAIAQPATPLQPGQIAAIAKGWGPIIATAAGGLLLRQVQPAGKRSQSGWDMANGLRLEVGEQLG